MSYISSELRGETNENERAVRWSTDFLFSNASPPWRCRGFFSAKAHINNNARIIIGDFLILEFSKWRKSLAGNRLKNVALCVSFRPRFDATRCRFNFARSARDLTFNLSLFTDRMTHCRRQGVRRAGVLLREGLEPGVQCPDTQAGVQISIQVLAAGVVPSQL